MFLINPAQKSFRTLLLLVNLSVSTMMSAIVEEWNAFGLGCHPALLPNFWGFRKNFHKRSVHGLTFLGRSLNVTQVCFLIKAYLHSASLI